MHNPPLLSWIIKIELNSIGQLCKEEKAIPLTKILIWVSKIYLLCINNTIIQHWWLIQILIRHYLWEMDSYLITHRFTCHKCTRFQFKLMEESINLKLFIPHSLFKPLFKIITSCNLHISNFIQTNLKTKVNPV